MIEYLDTNDGANSTTGTSGSLTTYNLEADTAWQTEVSSLEERPVTYEIIGTSITGTGTLTLQFRIDGDWVTAVDADGNNVTVSVASGLHEVIKDFQVVGLDQRWSNDGSATGGTITISRLVI